MSLTDSRTDKAHASRRQIILTLAGLLALFFVIYYVVLADIDQQSRNELDGRVKNVKVSFDALRDKAADVAWWVSSRPDITGAVARTDSGAIAGICEEATARTKVSSVLVVDAAGRLIFGAPSAEVTNVPPGTLCLADALAGSASAGIEEDAQLGMVMQATAPVRSDGKVTGAVLVRMNIFSDHSFVDSVVKSYGLVCSVFHNDTRISTTIYVEGKRALGTKLVNKAIVGPVLKNGDTYKGRNKVLEREYDTVYWPIRDVRGRIVGVLGIGKERTAITKTFSVIAILTLVVVGFIGAVLVKRIFSLQAMIMLFVVPAFVVITGLAGWLIYGRLNSIIIEGFNRKLHALSTSTAAFMDGDKLRNILATQDTKNQDYLSYIGPLREILKDKDVTYMYTFVLGGHKDIVYIIDASPGDDFCPIGYEEEVPLQNMDGLRKVVSEGAPYISEVQEYERYGLLKVSAAPVYGSNKVVRALSGVDINITVIRNKTRLALFEILGVGVLALVLAGLVSLVLSRRMMRPLYQVKVGALRLAAGQHDHRIPADGPNEVKDLAGAFNSLGQAIGGVLVKAGARDGEGVSEHETAELAAKLCAGAPADDRLDVAWIVGRPDCANASGCVLAGDVAVLWVAGRCQDALEAVKARADINAVAVAGLKRYGADVKRLIQLVDPMYRDLIDAFVTVSMASGDVTALVRRNVQAFVVGKDGGARPVQLSDRKVMSLRASETLSLVSGIPADTVKLLLSGGRINGWGVGARKSEAILAALDAAGAARDGMQSGAILTVERRTAS